MAADLRALILSNVDSAIKHNELTVKIVLYLVNHHNERDVGNIADQLLNGLEKLVEEGELVEVEYALPDSNYRCRSIYFPKGTELRIRQNPQATLGMKIDDDKVQLIKGTVHILEEGLPLCGFTSHIPSDWPPGHIWVGLGEKDKATCPECKAAMAS